MPTVEQPQPEPAVEPPAHPSVVASVDRVVELLRSYERFALQSRASLHPLSILSRVRRDSRYASPEQKRGQDSSPRSLIYSVGVLLFEKLTGCHPFDDAPLPGHAPAREAAERIAHIPAPLRAILGRALSPVPADRWPDVRALREALEQASPALGTGPAASGRIRARGSKPPPLAGASIDGGTD